MVNARRKRWPCADAVFNGLLPILRAVEWDRAFPDRSSMEHASVHVPVASLSAGTPPRPVFQLPSSRRGQSASAQRQEQHVRLSCRRAVATPSAVLSLSAASLRMRS